MSDASTGSPRRSGWRRLYLNLHIYGGLACSAYLVVYGVSSILANHRPNRFLAIGATREWSRELPAALTEGRPGQAARRVARALEVEGRILQAEVVAGEPGELRFRVHRPGRDFVVSAGMDGTVRVVEQRARLGSVLLGLHDARRVPGSLVLNSWWFYTAATVGLLLVLVGSGVLSWIGSRGTRRLGWRLAVTGPVLFLALVAWLMR